MTNTKTFTLGGRKLHLLFLTTVGSKLHKLNDSESDTDLKGVFVWDMDTLFGLETYPSVLDGKKTNKEEWLQLCSDLNKEFNLGLEDADDLALFELKKFFLSTLKNDFNMFDMLFSNEQHNYCSDDFSEVLLKRNLFLDTKKAHHTFVGMANGSLKEAVKLHRNNGSERSKFKALAKVLQFLYSFESMLDTHSYKPVLDFAERETVFNTKKGLVDFDKTVAECERLFLRVEEKYEHSKGLCNETNRTKLDKVLTQTTKNVLLRV